MLVLLDPTNGLWRLLQEMELTRRDSGLYVETNQRQGRRGGFGRRDCGRRRWLQKSFHVSLSLLVTSSEEKRDLKLREKWITCASVLKIHDFSKKDIFLTKIKSTSLHQSSIFVN